MGPSSFRAARCAGQLKHSRHGGRNGAIEAGGSRRPQHRRRRRASTAHPNYPIVVVSSPNPLALGWSTSLARPSRNVIGVLTLREDLAGKRVEILRELVPAARRVGVLYEIDNPGHDIVLANTQAASRSALTIVPFGLAEAGDLSEILVRIGAARLDGLIVVPSPYIGSHRREIIESAFANVGSTDGTAGSGSTAAGVIGDESHSTARLCHRCR
jgi:ABC-type uncharacterized transport system substrate-binding protein